MQRRPREKLRPVAAQDPDPRVIAEQVIDRLKWAPTPRDAPVRYLVSGTAPRDLDPWPDTATVVDRILRRARGLGEAERSPDDVAVVVDGYGWPPQGRGDWG
jgi:hypothetical protein